MVYVELNLNMSPDETHYMVAWHSVNTKYSEGSLTLIPSFTKPGLHS